MLFRRDVLDMTVFDYLYLKGREDLALQLLESGLAPLEEPIGGSTRLDAMLRLATIPCRTKNMIPLISAFMTRM